MPVLLVYALKSPRSKTRKLLLKVHVGTRPGYERKGMDVYTSTEVRFTTAVLGGEIIVPTLYGNVSC